MGLSFDGLEACFRVSELLSIELWIGSGRGDHESRHEVTDQESGGDRDCNEEREFSH